MLSYSTLSGAIAAERERALREKARTAWKRRQTGALQIRAAADTDAPGLLRLARLDSQGRPPAGRIVVAEESGELVAAISVDDDATIANPFRAAAPVVAMLRLRAEQIRGSTVRSQRRTLPSLRRLRARGAAA